MMNTTNAFQNTACGLNSLYNNVSGYDDNTPLVVIQHLE